MPPTKPPRQSIYQLRVSLCDVRPEVWRRVLVPGSIRLDKLHLMLQAAMGWTDSHLHAFTIGDARYGTGFDELASIELNEKSVTVISALRGRDAFVYEYDFGDSWEHDVLVEAVILNDHGLKFGVCIEGANACPPEDCGGTGGYEELLEALANPATDDQREFVAWVGGSFDASAFDLADANVRLQAIRVRHPPRET